MGNKKASNKTYNKNIKNVLKLKLLLALCLISNQGFAQSTKVIEMEGLNTLKFSKTEITAKPGQKITVRLTTVSKMPASAMAHNFVLLKQSADATKIVQASANYADKEYIAPEMKDQLLACSEMASGGETVAVTFTAPEKLGNYIYICTFPGHFLAGMKGTLTVK